MDTSGERDQLIERLLRQSLRARQPADVTGSCLDAETLAAWVEGTLSSEALEMAQTHVADCARCQSLIGAMGRMNPVVPQPEPERALRRWLPWLVPLTAAAAAVAVWIAVPGDLSTPPPPGPSAENSKARTADAIRQRPGAPDDLPRAPAVAEEPPASQRVQPIDKKTENQAQVPELRKDVGRLEAENDALKEQAAASPPPSTAAPKPQPPAEVARAAGSTVAESAKAADVNGARRAGIASAVVEVLSPDSSVRWRITGSLVERSTNGGDSWDAVPTGVATALTAGAAPATMVCWMVGRGGVVLLSTDGRTWRRVAFPEMTDLSTVTATDARTASVSTADGRIFSTSDAGGTWEQR